MNRFKLYYFFDPMCGWCYGFGNILTRLSLDYPDMDMEVICGGMVIGKREGPVGDTGKYINNLIPRVEQFSGRQFGDKYKSGNENGSLNISSFKPSVAVCIAKELIPDKILKFTSRLQHKHFFEGHNLDDDEVYEDLAIEFKMDPYEFLRLLKDDKYKNQAKADFKYSADIGITGFPTLVAEINDQLKLVSYGFNRYSHVKQELDSVYQLANHD